MIVDTIKRELDSILKSSTKEAKKGKVSIVNSLLLDIKNRYYKKHNITRSGLFDRNSEFLSSPIFSINDVFEEYLILEDLKKYAEELVDAGVLSYNTNIKIDSSYEDLINESLFQLEKSKRREHEDDAISRILDTCNIIATGGELPVDIIETIEAITQMEILDMLLARKKSNAAKETKE